MHTQVMLRIAALLLRHLFPPVALPPVAAPPPAPPLAVPLDQTPPHCDELVLHKPGTCFYCDEYPDIQANRVAAHVRFTGEPGPASWRPCPSEAVRAAAVIHQWPGNRPHHNGVPGGGY